MNNIPRNEHPRPDRKRNDWINLNGQWDFEIDNAKVGVDKCFFTRDSLDSKITVPFSPESVLSGIGITDFINAVWYRRDLDIPAEWAGKRVILHIDACDYATTVYVNGQYVGDHRGGYTPFTIDITDKIEKGKNNIRVECTDTTEDSCDITVSADSFEISKDEQYVYQEIQGQARVPSA